MKKLLLIRFGNNMFALFVCHQHQYTSPFSQTAFIDTIIADWQRANDYTKKYLKNMLVYAIHYRQRSVVLLNSCLGQALILPPPQLLPVNSTFMSIHNLYLPL
jgi:hypothetical protein